MNLMIYKYVSFQFFSSLLLWLPIFYKYQKAIGMTESQIFGIQSIYYIIFCVFELPSGLLADYFGRLKSLRAGATLMVVSHLVIILFPNYTGFFVHYVLFATARLLLTGASSAYLYDQFAARGRENEYKSVEGKTRALSLLGRVVCWPAVGFLMHWHQAIPYWLTGLSSLIAFALVLSLPVEKAQMVTEKRDSFYAVVRGVVLFLYRTPRVVGVIFQGVVIFILARICQVNLLQPLLHEKEFSLVSFGLIMSLMSVFEAIGAANAGILQRWMDNATAVFALTVATSITFVLLALSGQVGTVFSLCVFSLMAGTVFPIQRQCLNDAVPHSSYRATILSIESIIDRAGCAGVVLLLGSYTESGRVSDFLMHSAGVGMIVMSSLALLLGVRLFPVLDRGGIFRFLKMGVFVLLLFMQSGLQGSQSTMGANTAQKVGVLQSEKIGVIILAAGLGSRMKSDLPKVLTKIQDKPMLYYTLNEIKNVAPHASVALVVGYKKELVEAYVRGEENFKGMKISFIAQDRQLGTGHATRCAMDSSWGQERVREQAGILVLPGDLPLLSTGLVAKMTQPLNEGETLKLLTTFLENPKGYGRIIRSEGDNKVLKIVEEKDATPAQKAIHEVAVSTYLFDAEFLKDALRGLSTDNVQGEFYLTDLVANASNAHKKVVDCVWANSSDLRGVNDPSELAEAERIMVQRKLENKR